LSVVARPAYGLAYAWTCQSVLVQAWPSAARKEHPGQFFTLANAKPEVLVDMVEAGQFDAVIDIGMPPSDGSHFLSGFKLTNINIIQMIKLDTKYLRRYLENYFPFYVYGDTSGEKHIDHALLASPNIQLNSDCVTFDHEFDVGSRRRPWIAYLRLPEVAMQPFPSNANIAGDQSFFFKPGAKFNVILKQWWDADNSIYATLTLGKTVFIDTDMLNMNPVPEVQANVEPILHGSFGVYTGKETVDHPSVPLLRHVEPSMSEQYLGIINAAARNE